MVSKSVKQEPIDLHLDSDSDYDHLDDEKSPLLSHSAPSSRTASPEPKDEEQEQEEDLRFHQPPPSPFKRLGLLIILAFLFWAGYQLRTGVLEAKRKPKIVHASRYSKEHKFRPAASPIVTETLKDGRVRLRGALPPTPTPSVTPKTRVGKKGGKKKVGAKGTRKSTRNKGKAASGPGKKV